MLLPLFAAACSGADDLEDPEDHHSHEAEEENIGTVSSELTATSPVSSAVTGSCSTTSVKALSLQLVQEIQCLKPGSMKRIDATPGLALGAAVFPYLQTPAANALIAAQKARGVTLSINSGLRALPQQYLLYRWYQTKRCGIGLAAKPGTSNHESGIAVDIANNASWRSAMNSKGFSWLGASDPVHFDFRGGGTVSMKGLSVLAFQRLWNRNNPQDKIAEDGSYGPQTETRLAKAPVGGFAKGALCGQTMSAPMDDFPEDGSGDEQDPIAIPDATEPSVDAPAASANEEKTTTGASLDLPAAEAAEQGCAVSPGASARGSLGAAFALGLAGVGLAQRRRRRR
ncbi:MAG: D-alanyl-D-alanine carboxypeptidase family protein [Labilithrix sp.]|nr:D-alanyl-D-alanine carboxypeptidase family protein [Labilithrix sp.]